MDFSNDDSRSEDIFNSDDFGELLKQYDYPAPTRGDILSGEIVRFSDKELLIDVGAKRTATVPYTELQGLANDITQDISVGDEIDVVVTRTPRGDEELIVSVEQILVERDWDRAQEILESEEVIEVSITGHNRGGVIAEFGRIRGFIPNSKLPDIRNMSNQNDQQSAKSRMVGTQIALQVIQVNRQQDRLVLSASKIHDNLAESEMKALEVGQTVQGRIVNIKKYGAFVEFGHLTGLLHISKISHQLVNHPGDLLTAGDELELMVDEIDAEKGHISLNRIALLPNPYEAFAAAHESGALVEGTIEGVVDFGVFVSLDDLGVSGLLHISEMIIAPGSHPREVFEKGERVLLSLLSIDVAKERIALSLRKVDQAAQVAWMIAQAAEADAKEEAVAEVEDEEEALVEVEDEFVAEVESEAVEAVEEEAVADVVEDAAEADATE